MKVEPVGEFELKGIRLPLAAYNVVPAVSQCASGSLRLVMALLFPIWREPSQTRSEFKRRSTAKMI